MTAADMDALGLLRKAAGDDVEPWMWDLIEKQVSEHGINGLTPTAYAVLEGIVAKHGDPSRPGYAAMHPGGGHHMGTAHADSASKLKAGRAQLRGGDPVVFNSLSGRHSGTYVQRNGNGTHTVRTEGSGTSKVKDDAIAPKHLAHLLGERRVTSMVGTLY